jgi:hypothetical protein
MRGRFLTLLTLAFIAFAPAPALAQNDIKTDPAYLDLEKAFDFKTIKPEVNINLPKFLLKDALAELDGGKNDPFAGTGINVAELIQDIKLIRVVVIENKNAKEAITKGMATLKETLDKKWTPIAVISEEKEKVAVYAISDPSGESTAGLALLIHEGDGTAVIGNIVGKVSIGKIVKAASSMNKFPKDLLKKLTAAAGTEPNEKPKEKFSPLNQPGQRYKLAGFFVKTSNESA